MTLPADKRVKVAEAVTGREHRWGNGENFGERPGRCLFRCDSLRAHLLRWEPDEDVYQKDALVQKVAQMIEAIPSQPIYRFQGIEGRFIKALATNNTDDLENLCHELMSGEVNG